MANFFTAAKTGVNALMRLQRAMANLFRHANDPCVPTLGTAAWAHAGRIHSSLTLAPRIIIVQFDNFEKMQALMDSAAFRQAIAQGDKYATQRVFGVEGMQ